MLCRGCRLGGDRLLVGVWFRSGTGSVGVGLLVGCRVNYCVLGLLVG